MNPGFRTFFSNISLSVLAQLVTLSVSAFLILYIPKLLDLESFGYWQLYLLYASYFGFLHFGLIDGIYLRYGGRSYDSLDKPLFRSQFWILLISQLLFGLIIFIIASQLIIEYERKYIFSALAFFLLLLTMNGFFLFILQTTNRIKDYAVILIIDRLSFLLIAIVILSSGIKDFRYIIMADITARTIALIIGTVHCRQLVFGKVIALRPAFVELSQNVSAGIKLLFSNLAGILIIGIVRWLIEQNWDLITFAKISLTISISNIFLVFITAISIVVFPMLKKVNENRLSEIYLIIRNILIFSLVILLSLYFPIKYFIGNWLPEYDDKLIYLALLFPIALFESKFSLLITTYYKALRKETLLLKINLASVFLCIILNLFFIYLNNLVLCVLSIAIVFIFRSVVSEIILWKILKINLIKDIYYELMITLVFIFSGWFLNNTTGLLLYFITFSAYLIVRKNDIKKTHSDFFKYLKQGS